MVGQDFGIGKAVVGFWSVLMAQLHVMGVSLMSQSDTGTWCPIWTSFVSGSFFLRRIRMKVLGSWKV